MLADSLTAALIMPEAVAVDMLAELVMLSQTAASMALVTTPLTSTMDVILGTGIDERLALTALRSREKKQDELYAIWLWCNFLVTLYNSVHLST